MRSKFSLGEVERDAGLSKYMNKGLPLPINTFAGIINWLIPQPSGWTPLYRDWNVETIYIVWGSGTRLVLTTAPQCTLKGCGKRIWVAAKGNWCNLDKKTSWVWQVLDLSTKKLICHGYWISFQFLLVTVIIYCAHGHVSDWQHSQRTILPLKLTILWEWSWGGISS